MKKYKKIFIDADAFIAVNTPNHPLHQTAYELTYQLEENAKLFTCTYVLLEVAAVLNKFYETNNGPNIAESIIDNPKIHIIAGDKFLAKGIERMKIQTSKNVSLNDCVYFEIADKIQADAVFTFDAHWRKNKFNILTLTTNNT